MTGPAGGNAIGIIETRGVVALTAGIEAMMKTADVQCTAVQRVSSGYYAAAIEGSVAAVRQGGKTGQVAVVVDSVEQRGRRRHVRVAGRRRVRAG